MIRIWCERVGLLGLLGACALATGLALQHLLGLPNAYDWGFPYHVLWHDALASSGFPSAAFVLACAGWASSGISLRRSMPTQRRNQLLIVLLAAIAAAFDWWLFDEHAPWDWLATGALVACLGALAARPGSRANWPRFVGSLAYGVAVFAAICFFYTVVKSSLFLRALPHDASLIALETKLFGGPPHRALAAFAATRPAFVACCDWVYFRFFHHMLLAGVLLATRSNADERVEYLAALGICYLFGAPLYHIYPAWGPGYFEPQYFKYLSDQRLTTAGVRLWLWRNTQDVQSGRALTLHTWSYIACMPSLHIAHEFVMAFYVRRPLPILALSLCFTAATLVSVLVLGWHYFVDGFGGIALAIGSIYLARRLRGLWWPKRLLASSMSG
jgi:hypothetical protein